MVTITYKNVLSCTLKICALYYVCDAAIIFKRIQRIPEVLLFRAKYISMTQK